MTIGIGVLCATKPKPLLSYPDSLVMVADTMGSTDTDSTDSLHKMWLNSDLGLYAVGAGNLAYGGELVSIIENEFRKLTKRTHGTISGALNISFQMLRAQHFQFDVIWTSLQIPNLPIVASPDKALEEWAKFYIEIQMVVGAFDDNGQANLYVIGQFEGSTKVVHLHEFPGHACIGSGGTNADFWLNYREQALNRSVRQSAYHAFEAKHMAAKSPTVNDNIEMAIVLPDGVLYHLREDRPEIKGCPVSLTEMKKMLKKYGPRKTISLGHILPKLGS